MCAREHVYVYVPDMLSHYDHVHACVVRVAQAGRATPETRGGGVSNAAYTLVNVQRIFC